MYYVLLCTGEQKEVKVLEAHVQGGLRELCVLFTVLYR